MAERRGKWVPQDIRLLVGTALRAVRRFHHQDCGRFGEASLPNDCATRGAFMTTLSPDTSGDVTRRRGVGQGRDGAV